jgi:hypothetical protein
VAEKSLYIPSATCDTENENVLSFLTHGEAAAAGRNLDRGRLRRITKLLQIKFGWWRYTIRHQRGEASLARKRFGAPSLRRQAVACSLV